MSLFWMSLFRLFPLRQRRQHAGELPLSGERLQSVEGGVIYAAPVLIAHYVEAHGYRPPDGFIAAVLNVEHPGAVPEPR